MIRDEDKWPALHAYRMAVERGHAPAILCPDCAFEVAPVPSDNGPKLKCYACNTTFSLALHFWEQLEAAIREINRTVEMEL